MAEVTKFTVDSVSYTVDDETARASAATAQSTADVALHSASGYYSGEYDGFVPLGRDLSTTFASEIGDDEPITWLQSRASEGDFDGLAIGDYLTVTLADDDSTAMSYQIAAFDHYYGVGDTGYVNGHHITMVPSTVYPEYVTFNDSATNNGTSDDGSPWLSSGLYEWMNETFYGYLPSAWRGAIIDVRLYLPTRYSSSGSLTDDSGGEWGYVGNVWAPSEREVWGEVRRGTYSSSIGCADRQLPIFRRATVVRCSSGTSRRDWWERCAASGSSTNVCYVNNNGNANANTATNANVRPLP